MRLIARLGNWKPRFAGGLQPGIHCHAQLCDRLLGCCTECGAGLQVRRIGDPDAVLLRPEYNDGVTVHGSVFEFQSELPYYIPQLAYLIWLCLFSHWLNIDGARHICVQVDMVAPGYTVQAKPKRYQQSLQVTKRDRDPPCNNLLYTCRTLAIALRGRMNFPDDAPDLL